MNKSVKVLGIIAEYNPFHNGHLYHLCQSKEMVGADFVVAVMSGNFVQRGEPALIDKYERAKTAVENGVDLVIELPVAYACNNSEMFARGAIQILNGLGCLTHLSFGSESGKLSDLEPIAEVLAEECEVFKNTLRENLSLGFSFAKSRQMGINAVLGMDVSTILTGSNNILAIEYLKQLKLTKSSISPVTVIRKGPAYKEENSYGSIASATRLRTMCENQLEIKDFVPPVTWGSVKKQGKLLFLKDFHSLIFGRLLQISKKELGEIYAVSEGLENRIKNQIRQADSLNQLIEGVVSKRYAETRIKRLLIQSLLGIKKCKFNAIINKNINYCRVLGFNEKGASLLRLIKGNKMNSLQLVTNINKEVQPDSDLWELLEFDVLASDLFNLASQKSLYENSDYTKSPFH